MKVLVVGQGGREHALAFRLGQSPSVTEVICAPGNDGIAAEFRCVDIAADASAKIAAFCAAEKIDLVVVGPELSLVAGLSDLLVTQGRAVFGCSRAAAELEGSKSYAKTFMARHNIPTAAFGTFSDESEAGLFIDTTFDAGAKKVVVKADGLAAGKGVTICESALDAKALARRLLIGGELGAAGAQLVIEEFLQGDEASLMAFVDGEQVLALAPAEDHKTIFDYDAGPMTGGMGVVSPTPVLSDLLVRRTLKDVLEPTARGMVAEGRPFRGLLYAGIMVTAAGPKVLEFNVRFGDPETQPLMLRLQDDLGALLMGVATGAMPRRVRFSDDAAVCVVMAAAGYPGAITAGQKISGLDRVATLPNVKVFHAGTAKVGDDWVTKSGRVLGVTAMGADLATARARAYEAVAQISFDGAQYRRDIGARQSTLSA